MHFFIVLATFKWFKYSETKLKCLNSILSIYIYNQNFLAYTLSIHKFFDKKITISTISLTIWGVEMRRKKWWCFLIVSTKIVMLQKLWKQIKWLMVFNLHTSTIKTFKCFTTPAYTPLIYRLLIKNKIASSTNTTVRRDAFL